MTNHQITLNKVLRLRFHINTMKWKDKEQRNEYYRLKKKRERSEDREGYNSKAREYAKKWRKKNKDKVHFYNVKKVADGVLKRSLAKQRNNLSDSYIKGLISQSVTKTTITQKKANVLKFRIKKIISQVNGKST